MFNSTMRIQVVSTDRKWSRARNLVHEMIPCRRHWTELTVLFGERVLGNWVLDVQQLRLGRQGEMKGCSSSIVSGRPQPLPMRLHNGTAVTRSNLSILPCHADHVGSFLRDRSRDSQPFHSGHQRGSFQSEFGRCTAWSAHDPANLLKGFHDQSMI
jgi:hypothetical protein